LCDPQSYSPSPAAVRRDSELQACFPGKAPFRREMGVSRTVNAAALPGIPVEVDCVAVLKERRG
jgi:hypothetical protein